MYGTPFLQSSSSLGCISPRTFRVFLSFFVFWCFFYFNSRLGDLPWISCISDSHINTLRPRQSRCQFGDDIFKCIFLNENAWIAIEISLKFVPKGPVNNIPALVPIMAWCRSGDRPISEPSMVSSLTHICVTRPPWVKQRIMSRKVPVLAYDSPCVVVEKPLASCVMIHI